MPAKPQFIDDSLAWFAVTLSPPLKPPLVVSWHSSVTVEGVKEAGMPFRERYGGVYEPATLARLQDIFEHVWQAMVEGKAPIVSRDDLARMIIKAYDAGMPAETIKEVLAAEIGTTIDSPRKER